MEGKSVSYKKKRLIEVDDSDIEDLKRGVVVADIFDGEIVGVIYNPKKSKLKHNASSNNPTEGQQKS